MDRASWVFLILQKKFIVLHLTNQTRYYTRLAKNGTNRLLYLNSISIV